MCGIAALLGEGWDPVMLHRMVAALHHRGPDGSGTYFDPRGRAALGHTRLSIIDLSTSGAQPMRSRDGRFVISFNGEIYNYLELRCELRGYPFATWTDTEVLLAAFERWGAGCLDRLVGMFAFVVWDTQEQSLFAARDRFGVKPLFLHRDTAGRLALSSEIRALRAVDLATYPDEVAWASYLTYGVQDQGERTFWRDVSSLPAGHCLTWRDGALRTWRWYDIAERVGREFDERPTSDVSDEYRALLEESIRLRFRADVPLGINLSGGLDSSTLLGLVHATQGEGSEVSAFTFTTGDDRYDELPWVSSMLSRTRHPLVECRLTAEEVPALAESVQRYQDEPFGGIPTLAYAKLFAEARARGVYVLLDGQGMDEQWAGYDYYRPLTANGAVDAPVVQGASGSPFRPDCLEPEFRALAQPLETETPFPDRLRNLQYRDLVRSKLPRALRFNDRVSMRSSVELREPFLDHRLVELALRQPVDRKVRGATGKWMLRQLVAPILPRGVAHAPKRALQTPQREWLRGPLRSWVRASIDELVQGANATWLDADEVRLTLERYEQDGADNSYFVWQWLSLAMATQQVAGPIHSR